MTKGRGEEGVVFPRKHEMGCSNSQLEGIGRFNLMAKNTPIRWAFTASDKKFISITKCCLVH